MKYPYCIVFKQMALQFTMYNIYLTRNNPLNSYKSLYKTLIHQEGIYIKPCVAFKCRLKLNFSSLFFLGIYFCVWNDLTIMQYFSLLLLIELSKL